ncbi:MAG: hypothetical protein WC048_18590 [Rhizobium sp.]
MRILPERPDRQTHGIGSAWIQKGTERLRAHGARGCVLIGGPAPEAADAPTEYFLVPTLQGSVPSGIVAFDPDFYGNAT